MHAFRFLLALLVVLPFLARGPCTLAQDKRLTDSNGDPLPDGAVGRLGTTRLRHGGSVWDVAFLPDGKTLASLDRGFVPAIRLWDRATGKEIASHRLGPDLFRSGTFSPNLRLVACRDGEKLGVYEIVSGKRLLPDGLPAGNRGLCCFSGDSRTLLVDTLDGIEQWDLGTGKKRQTLALAPGQAADISHLIATCDGKLLAAWDRAGGEAVVWALSSGTMLYRFAVAKRTVLTFAPDNQTLAAVREDGSAVVLRAAATGKTLPAIKGIEKAFPVAFSADGSTLAIACAKGTLRLWNVRRHKVTATLASHHGAIDGLWFSRDGRTLATAHRGANCIQVWQIPARPDAAPFMLPLDGPAFDSCVFSGDGKMLATTWANTIRLWDIAARKEIAVPTGASRGSDQLALAPDGRTVASFDHDGEISIWDATTQRQRKQWSAAWGKPQGLAFSPDGKTLISLYDDSATAHLWDVATGKLLRRAQGPKGSIGCTIAPDGSALLAQRYHPDVFSVIDLASGKQRVGIAKARRPEIGPRLDLCTAFTPDGKRCALVELNEDDGSIKFTQWDAASGRELPRIALTSGLPCTVTYSFDGRLLAGLCLCKRNPLQLADADLVCWDTLSGKECLRIEQTGGVIGSLAFAPDSRRLAFGRQDGTIQLWDVPTGKLLRRLDGHRGAVMAMQCSADGKTLYSASSDTTVLLWDLTRWSLAAVTIPPAALDAAWVDLASADAAKALRAIGVLTSVPKQAVPLLARRVKPTAVPAKEQVQRWIVDLGSDDFDKRHVASMELARHCAQIEPALRAALRSSPTLETRHRLESLLKSMNGIPHSEELRPLRAVHALELMGHAEARTLLNALAKGAVGARLTRTARESLARLAKRGSDLPP